jgi:gluconolactonase
VRASRTYHWSTDGAVTVAREDTAGANGLYLAPDGRLVECEGGGGRIVAVSPAGEVGVVADAYAGKRFNRPNDLWVDPRGGIYFSDPLYGGGEPSQDGEHVYYIPPDHASVVRVADDLVRPNGLIGTPDGRTLYIADAGAERTYRYAIKDDGGLADKSLFVERGSDGMTMDERGNVYLVGEGIGIYSPAGALLGEIAVPERPTNLTFAGEDGRTLFITARSTIYTLRMAVRGAR